MSKIWFIKDKKKRCKFFIILLLTILMRFVGLGIVPGGGALNQDEAFAGYEAWSLLHYGYDADGFNNPVYFVAWGSGMNVLESYCMIPFIATFGLNPLGIRFASAILGVVTVVFFYLFLKETMGNKYALVGMSLLCIMPWNVMNSRWGLESNFLPGFILFSQYFLLKSVRKKKFFIVSMIFWGLTLYAYSVAWAVIPLLLVVEIAYFFMPQSGVEFGFDKY